MKKIIINFILSYFRFFAKLQLLKTRPLIIGITGSAGKTSTMAAVNALLKNKRKVKVGYGANSETGIPLNILGLKPTKFSFIEWLKLMVMCPIKLITNWESYDTCIVEMGIDSPIPPKNMGFLLSIVKPNVAVILNAAPMHSQPFDYLVDETDPEKRAVKLTELIAKEKGRIVTELNPTDTAIINIDQKEIAALEESITARLIKFGENKKSDVQALSIKTTLSGTLLQFSHLEKTVTIELEKQLLPNHFLHTFAATISVGLAVGMSLDEAAKEIENNFKLPAGRSTLIEGVNGSYIIDSSYNSSTKPTIDMLQLLKSLPAKSRYAILGDIRELGEVSKLEHEKVAHEAIKNCDAVILVGPLMKEFALPIIEKTKTQVHWFKNGYEAAEFLKPELKPEDLVLIKASQNTLLLEISVEILMKHPGMAEQLLARRGKYWDKRREEIKEK